MNDISIFGTVTYQQTLTLNIYSNNLSQAQERVILGIDLLKVMGTSLSGNRRYNYSGTFYSGGQNVQIVRMGNPGDPNLAQLCKMPLLCY